MAGESDPEAPEISAFGEFRLDASERSVLRAGVPVGLTPKSFETLLLLVRRAGHLVTREEFARSVWPDVHVTEGALRQKILLLRKELGDESEPHRMIETVPRLGYRFIAPVTRVSGEESSSSPVRPRGLRHLWLAAPAAVALLVVGGIILANRSRSLTVPNVPTRDPEARREFLRARFFWNKRTADDLAKAAEAYELAVRKDPRFAAAWAGLADTKLLLGVAAVRPEAHEARSAAARAIELDDSLGAAHGTLAFERFFFEWDFAGAKAEFARAIELAPEDATIRQRHAFYLVCLGRPDDALQEIRHARELDPTSLSINEDVGEILFWAHRYGDAIEEFRKVNELEANPAWHGHLAYAYLYSGRLDEARAEFALRHESAASDAVCRVFVSVAAGHVEDARAALGEVEGDAGYVATHSEALASVHAVIGDEDGALRFLEKAFAEHNFGLLFLNVSPHYDGMRKDPRFQDLLRRIGLV